MEVKKREKRRTGKGGREKKRGGEREKRAGEGGERQRDREFSHVQTKGFEAFDPDP